MKIQFYVNNRQSTAKVLPGSLIVLSALSTMQRSGDTAFQFGQEANFWYITGLEEAGWRVIIDNVRNHTTLVRPQLSEMQQIFDGGMSKEQAIAASGANDVIEARDFEPYIRELARKHSVVYSIYDKTPYDFVVNPAQRELHATLTRIFQSVQSCESELHKLRAIKQPEEIAVMQKSIDLTCNAFREAREMLPTMKYEYELEAYFGYMFRKHGAQHAYDPIVAHGENACTLHYVANNMKLSKSRPTLIDIGARIDNYCADITRTYMLQPTKRQQHVHTVLQDVHSRIIELLAPSLSVEAYSAQVDILMKQALIDLDLLKDQTDDKTYRKYFPHAVSHGLGIDVHDSLGKPRVFEEGMVLTVEPGIYIADEKIGMRIEDDILITDKGHRNLSGKLSTNW